ncbi:hypothetical protein BH09BAC3_BH09BAC3_14610 [soil metagenome]
MNEFLKKIGLLDHMIIELLIRQSDFVDTLQANVDPKKVGLFEAFSSSKNMYKGSVSYDGFEIRRKKKIFETTLNLTKATGKISQLGEKLIVNIEVNGFHWLTIVFVAMIASFYAIFIAISLTVDIGDVMFVIPVLLVHALFMLGIPYIALRRGLTTTKYNLERDIHFMMKDKVRANQC